MAKANFWEKFLFKFIIWGSFLVVLVPIIIVPESYFPYIIQKTIILRILLSLLFSAYLILAVWKKEYRPKNSFIFWSSAAYFAVMIITTITSQSIARSWWGNWERSLGTFNLLHYLGWFIMLVAVFKKTEHWNKIFNFSLIVSVLISLYSIAQRLGLAFTFQPGLERVNGTMGNASFLASYLLLHLFIALLFLLEKKSIKWRAYYLSVFLLDFFVMLLTGTRGALLAIFAALVAFLFFAIWLKPFSLKASRILLGATVFLLLIGALVFWQKNSNFVKNNYWLKRITGLSLEDNTVQTRIRSWTWGIKGFRDNLLTGVGPENYQIVFNRYFTGDFYDYSSSEIWFDRAHNTYVDQASTMGIFGLLTYLLIFYAVSHHLNKFRKSGQLSAQSFIVLWLLFFSYFVQNIFVFDSLNSYIIFFLLLAYIHYLSVKFNTASLPVNGMPEENNPTRAYLAAPLTLFLFGWLLFGINLPDVRANNLVFGGYLDSYYGKYDQVINKYQRAKEISVNKLDLPILLSTVLGEALSKTSNEAEVAKRVEDLGQAVDWMNEAIALDPNNMFLYYIQAKNYALLTEKTADPKYLEKGLAVTQKAHELSPGRVRPFWLFAQFYLFAGDKEQALKNLDAAEAINPRLSETYFYRSVVYQSMEDEENFYKQYDKMIDNKYEFYSLNQVRSVLPHYESLNDLQRVIYLFQQVVKFDSQDPNNWDYLTDLLISAKQYDQAKSTLQFAAEKIPSYSGNAIQKYRLIEKLIQAEALANQEQPIKPEEPVN